MFEPPARDLLFRVAQPYLEQVRVTGTELMFDPREQRKILNAGTKFQEYLQRVAILQGQLSQKPVAERMRQTLDMVDAAMRAVEAAVRRGQAAADDAAVLDAAATAAPLDAGIALALALAAAPPGDFAARATICFRLLAGVRTPVAVDLLDHTLAQMMRLKIAAAALVGPADALAVQIRACLAIAGDADAIRANRSPFVAEVARLNGVHALPHLAAAAVDAFDAALASPAKMAERDPMEELKTTRDLRKKIAALPVLAAAPQLAENLSRRMSRLVVPESLDPLLARELGTGRKLLALVRLYNEIDDTNARRHLDAMVNNLVESRDFKDEFFAPGLAHDERRTLVVEVAEALGASEMLEMRKMRYREVAAMAFADLGQVAGRRISPRMSAGPEDRVQLMGQRVPLRNWSEAGLLFGPFAGTLLPGQTVRATILLRNAYISIGFEATLEIVRFSDGLVGAKYTCADPHVRQRIKTHFAAA
ncbi:MAG: hypothetical protein ING44_01230 [Telmatospirillum sp.]|nr:hypothetical protein [Telmatospirillum sp.]